MKQPAEFSLEETWNKYLSKIPLGYISLFLGLIGASLLWRYPEGYFRHALGEALTIAALLILLVDPVLKARLLREASRDIFHYLLGFDQQPEIKERMKRLVFDTKLYRKNFNARYKLAPQEDGWMRIEMEYDFELINPTEEAIEFRLKLDCEEAEKPDLESLGLISSEGNYTWHPKLKPKDDDPCVLQAFADPVKIQPESKGVTYRYSGKCTIKYPLSFYYAQHFGYPTIGVTVTVECPSNYQVSMVPTPTKSGNTWVYNKLYMPGDHVNIRWKPKISK